MNSLPQYPKMPPQNTPHQNTPPPDTSRHVGVYFSIMLVSNSYFDRLCSKMFPIGPIVIVDFWVVVTTNFWYQSYIILLPFVTYNVPRMTFQTSSNNLDTAKFKPCVLWFTLVHGVATILPVLNAISMCMGSRNMLCTQKWKRKPFIHYIHALLDTPTHTPHLHPALPLPMWMLQAYTGICLN